MGWLNDPQVWASLLTLTALEIVLGIDNLVFITILAGRLPAKRQNRARQTGLGLALITRLALLASIAWIIGLTQPVFEILGRSISWRDLILIGGGFFLLYKGTREIHQASIVAREIDEIGAGVEGIECDRRKVGGSGAIVGCATLEGDGRRVLR